MTNKLDKLRQDLDRAYSKRDEWNARVDLLEQKVREEENTQIHEMVRAANMTPEQLAKLLQQLNGSETQEDSENDKTFE